MFSILSNITFKSLLHIHVVRCLSVQKYVIEQCMFMPSNTEMADMW